MPKCSRCGEELEAGRVFCSTCGQPVEAAATAPEPSAAPSSPGAAAPPRGAYLQTGWALFKQYPGGFVGFTVLAILIEVGLGCLPKAGWLVFFIHYPLMFGFLAVSAKLLQGESPHFGDFFDGFRYFLTLFCLGVVSQILIVLGLLALVVPGVYLLVGYLLAPLFVLDRGAGFWQALELSRRTVQPRWFELFGLSLLIILINLLGMLPLGLGLLVTIPVSWCAITAAYAEIVGFQSAPLVGQNKEPVAPAATLPNGKDAAPAPPAGIAERSLAREFDWKPVLTLIAFVSVMVLAGIYLWMNHQGATKKPAPEPAVMSPEPAPHPTAQDYWKKGNESKDLQEKIFLFTKAIELDPHYAEAYNNRGNVYYDKRDYELALMDYNKTISLKPDYIYAYNNRGRIYYDKKDYDRALIDFNKAIELKPDYAYAYNNRGNIYYDKKDNEQALINYTRAIELKHDYVYAYNNRGNVYYRQKDYERAITDYSKAITLKPDFAVAYCNRGNAYYYQGDYDKALPDYNKAIAIKPDYANAYYRRAIFYKKTGDYDKARTDYDQAKSLNPKLPDLPIPLPEGR